MPTRDMLLRYAIRVTILLHSRVSVALACSSCTTPSSPFPLHFLSSLPFLVLRSIDRGNYSLIATNQSLFGGIWCLIEGNQCLVDGFRGLIGRNQSLIDGFIGLIMGESEFERWKSELGRRKTKLNRGYQILSISAISFGSDFYVF